MATFSVTPLAIPAVLLIQPRKFTDHRGYFVETFSDREFERLGIVADFVQDNQSLSVRRGTIRGLHFQIPPRAQAKLVRVVSGSVFDVAIDLRHASPTYGKWCAATLTAAEGNQLFIPRGFAHGFCTLEDNAEVTYKVDDYYAPECEQGLIWNDPDIAVDWPIADEEVVLSDKDIKHPRLLNFRPPFVYSRAE
jgi:dTDP-4-dehydrorhamnose 3,5-epimerase